MSDDIQNPIPNEKEIDLTKQRDERVKRAVQKVLQVMFEDELLLEDIDYVEQMVKLHLEALFKNLALSNLNEIMSLLHNSLKISFDEAMKKLWGGRYKDEITLPDIDQALKEGKVDPVQQKEELPVEQKDEVAEELPRDKEAN